MSTASILLLNLAAVAAPVVILWLISLAIEDVSIVDIFWGLGFVIVAWTTFAVTGERNLQQILLAVLPTIWGVRLAGYLAWRNLGKGEDRRYQAIRARIGPSFRWISLFYIFLFQAMLVWIVSLPVQLGQIHGTPAAGLTVLQAVGIAAWAVGMFFETVGDIQLARFKANPANAGKVMDRGLWRYTRHPNYFGDFMVWWGLFLVAVATPGALVQLGWTAVGPAIMSILLMRVSGVTLLEKDLRKRRPGYEEYIRRTSAFFPRPPRP